MEKFASQNGKMRRKLPLEALSTESYYDLQKVLTLTHTSHSKRKYICRTQQKQNNDGMNITMRSALKIASIRKLNNKNTMAIQERLKNQQNENDEHFSQKLKLTKLYRIGNFSKVYCALLTQPTAFEVIVKKISVQTSHKSREEHLAKTLKSPYIVKFIGTYHSNEQEVEQKQESQKLNIEQFTPQNEAKAEYLNIVMSKYGNNLSQIIQIQDIEPFRRKIYLYQMLRSLVYIHSLNICHRDIKPHNFVVKSNRVVLCDFGASKIIDSKDKSVTYIFDRQYRAPQLLFDYGNYDKSVDIWAFGCVAAELALKKPLFDGTNNLDQLVKILKVLGSPRWETVSFCNSRIPKIPKITGSGFEYFLKYKCDQNYIDFVSKLCRLQPKQRPTAVEALCHPFFDEIREESFYRNHLRSNGLPNLYYFSKKQSFQNEHLLNKLVPYWFKQHCKRFDVSIKDYSF